MAWISWTCWDCDKVVAADAACACGATFKPKPPYPFCSMPEKCAPSGRCEREICCAD